MSTAPDFNFYLNRYLQEADPECRDKVSSCPQLVQAANRAVSVNLCTDSMRREIDFVLQLTYVELIDNPEISEEVRFTQMLSRVASLNPPKGLQELNRQLGTPAGLTTGESVVFSTVA